ncbi:MAG: transcriptional coactivator p15/PC4 family protein [Gaiellaceae bacterium]
MSDHVVYTFRKNSREAVRATLSEFRGRQLADLRVWAATDEGDVATRKGISVRVEDVSKLLEAVQALVAAHERESRREAA